MIRTCISTLTAAALALTSLSATPAFANDNDKLARWLAGAATLVIIGTAIDQANKKEKKKPKAQVVHQPQPPRHQQRHHTQRPQHKSQRPLNHAHGHYAPGRGALPRHCVRFVPKRNGDTYRTLGQRCLKRHYAGAHNLPRVCRESVRMNGKWRATYKIRCLRDYGYRIARH